MNINKITKQELLGILQERDVVIESMRKEIAYSRNRLDDAYRVSRDHSEEKERLKEHVSKLLQENLADIKSLQNLLCIFHNDVMTHREKSYLSRKINQVCESLIQERIEAINNFYRHKDGMPF